MTTFVGTSANERSQVLHHLNPPYLDSNITSKGNLGKKTKFSKATKECKLKYMQAMAKMDYSFVVLQFLLFNVSKGFLI